MFTAVVGAIVSNVSEEDVDTASVVTLGTVMNLEPSLFVYFEEEIIVFGRGGWADCKRGFAGIPSIDAAGCNSVLFCYRPEG